LKIPPPVVGLAVAALMWLAARGLPTLVFEFPARTRFAAGFVIGGIAIAAAGVVAFRRAKTTVNPMQPASSSSLVVSGVYQMTRNPMYLGFLLVLVGWAIFLANAIAFLLLPVFVFYMNRFQIEPEERALSALFGEEFGAYRARVRRWL
jgi:protein-S-isoprenylcysteine O-methyltransferase Ste14